MHSDRKGAEATIAPVRKAGGDGETKSASQQAVNSEEAILRMLGLARRSRSLICGADGVITAVRSAKKPAIVLVAGDASERTKKQLSDKCATYGVPIAVLKADRPALAAAIGNRQGQCSACAVTDRNMANKIDSLIQASMI